MSHWLLWRPITCTRFSTPISLYFIPLPFGNFRRVCAPWRPWETISRRGLRTSVSGYETHIWRQASLATEAKTWLGMSVSASSCEWFSSKWSALDIGVIHNNQVTYIVTCEVLQQIHGEQYSSLTWAMLNLTSSSLRVFWTERSSSSSHTGRMGWEILVSTGKKVRWAERNHFRL